MKREHFKDADLQLRAARAYSRRTREALEVEQEPSAGLSSVERVAGQRPLIVLRNIRGVLARYRYNAQSDRLSRIAD